MASVADALDLEIETFADLQRHLGDVPASRIRLKPSPGTATEKDVLAIHAKENRLFELVDGVLVEKAMGYQESYLAVRLIIILGEFVTSRKLGIVAGADGMLKLASGLVRIPDVSFISWNSIPDKKVPKKPIPKLAPDLAVEVVSESNTAGEMNRKLREYFKAGVKLVWMIDAKARTVDVHTGAKKKTTLSEKDTLDGGRVIPGFTLPLATFFGFLDEEAP